MADYDVIVAGGGLAGTVAAQSVSKYSKQNLRVLVVDRNPPITPGRKNVSGWICGDAVSKEAVDYMGERTGVTWGEPEIEHKVKGVMAFSARQKDVHSRLTATGTCLTGRFSRSGRTSGPWGWGWNLTLR